MPRQRATRGDVEPAVRHKELEEVHENGRKLLAAAVKKLRARIESGDATAADFNAAARLLDLLGLDRLMDLSADEHTERLERALEELDRESAEGWESTDSR